jgi:hypothetical protein
MKTRHHETWNTEEKIMSKILSLTAVGVVAAGLMLAMPAKSEAGVGVSVGPVVGTVSTYPAAPYGVYAPAPVVVAPPVYPAPVIVRPYPYYYRGYGYGYRGYPHYHGWHR